MTRGIEKVEVEEKIWKTEFVFCAFSSTTRVLYPADTRLVMLNLTLL